MIASWDSAMAEWVLSGTEINELLNTLAQPTAYERARQRLVAVKVARTWTPMVVADQLEGLTSPRAAHLQTLRKKYRITDEELYVTE